MLVKSFTLLAFLCGSLASVLGLNPDIKLPDSLFECGLQNVQPENVNEILNDNYNGKTQFAEFPWMMAIFKKEFEYKKFICGGSLLSRRVVLTSAHNIDSIQAKDLRVRAGEWDLQTETKFLTHQDRQVMLKRIHPEFSTSEFYNDVALLLVDYPFDYQENVKPICLPPFNMNFDYTSCLVTSWDLNKFVNEGYNHSILEKNIISIVPYNECQNSSRQTHLGDSSFFHATFICAKCEEQKDFCHPVGGSPLVCRIPLSPDHFYQVGISSWMANYNHSDVPAVYTNVVKLRTWINDQIMSWAYDPTLFSNIFSYYFRYGLF